MYHREERPLVEQLIIAHWLLHVMTYEKAINLLAYASGLS
jgi:hypothetical protein